MTTRIKLQVEARVDGKFCAPECKHSMYHAHSLCGDFHYHCEAFYTRDGEKVQLLRRGNKVQRCRACLRSETAAGGGE